MLSTIIHIFQEAYMFSIPILLLLFFVLKKHQKKILEYLYASNLIIMIIGMISLLSLLLNSDFGSFENLNRIFGPFWFVFWIYIFAYILLPQLFWIKKFRTNILVSFSIVLLMFGDYFIKYMSHSSWFLIEEFNLNSLLISLVVFWVVLLISLEMKFIKTT